MQTIDKVKNICNYTDNKNLNSNTLSFSWIETISSLDEEFLNHQKRINRELTIGVVLDEVSESEWKSNKENNFNIPFNESPLSSSTTSVISTRLMSATVNAIKYQDESEIYDFLIDFLDKNTQSSKNIKGSPNSSLDLKLKNNYNNLLTESENYEADIRRIITKITMHSNIVAMEGRLSPANTIIVGENNWEHFDYIETKYGVFNMLVIYDNNIDKDKVIICRRGKINEPGLLLTNDLVNKNFYFKETTFWDRQYSWFLIN